MSVITDKTGTEYITVRASGYAQGEEVYVTCKVSHYVKEEYFIQRERPSGIFGECYNDIIFYRHGTAVVTKTRGDSVTVRVVAFGGAADWSEK